MFKKTIFISIIIFSTLFFQGAYAQNEVGTEDENTIAETKSEGLVPCGHDRPCTTCDLIVGIKGVIDFLTRMLAIVGLFIITVAGVMYIVSSGDSGMVSKAKSAIKNVLVGIVIVLTAWVAIVLILTSISVDFDEISGDEVALTKEGAWSFECSTESNIYDVEEEEEKKNSEVKCGNTITPSCKPGVVIADLYIGLDNKKYWKCQSTDGKVTIPCPQGTGKSEEEENEESDKKEDEAQEKFREKKARDSWEDKSNGLIGVWESAVGKTNIRDLRGDSYNGVLDFQEKYGKGFLVTGGAEKGKVHKGSDDPDSESHANGYKVDIQRTAAVDNFLVGHEKRKIKPYLTDTGKSWSNGTKLYTDPDGNIWAKEGTHWDVCFNCPKTSAKWGFK